MIRTQSRSKALDELLQFFYLNGCEDGQNGTNFDCDVMDAIDALKEKYGTEVPEGYWNE